MSAASSFRVLDPLDEADRQAWIEAWLATAHREVQAHPAYGLAVTPPDERLLGALAVTSTGTVVLPFAVREISFARDGARDAITPYGYGGAYVDGEVDPAWFWRCWDSWAASNGLSGITVRSHLFSDEVLPIEGVRVSPLTNVVVDLELSEEALWATYEGRVRTDVRRGRRLGVQITADEACSELGAFYSLYCQTMQAKGADDFYLFSIERLESLVESLGDGVSLFHAHIDGELVASEMELIGARNAYYFLSGATDEGRRTSANPTMKHEVIRWLKSRGVAKYVLGGGMRRDDSLFRYKRSFAPRNVVDFSVAFHEAREGAVLELVNSRRKAEPGWQPTPGFIPDYRAPDLRGNGS